jgi:hypothetical protein
MDDNPEIQKSIAAIRAQRPVKKLTWFQKWKAHMLWTWIENQLLKAKWSWPTSVCGVFGGLALILPELAKLLDSDPKTSPDTDKIAAGFGLMGLGLTAKATGNTGLPPTKMPKPADLVNPPGP